MSKGSAVLSILPSLGSTILHFCLGNVYGTNDHFLRQQEYLRL
jgi:hypothetical protein